TFLPHVIEPTFGIDRMLLVALLEAYHEDEAPTAKRAASSEALAQEEEKETRVVMRFPKYLAPIQVAVLPLSKKKELADVAAPIAATIRKFGFSVEYDETQSIGKRYRRQDEIGTPYCVTVDFDSLNDKSVTVRERDSMKQERIKIEELTKYLQEQFK
ncbi:MAG: glycine--tRNA ligase, partial [Candidatus Yonathbacteria bacterium]|nr:glycine--tRNA ligase [Candidatus Yonathbacteria bacterium]